MPDVTVAFSTSDRQDTGNASLANIDSNTNRLPAKVQVGGVDALPTKVLNANVDPATGDKQSTGNASLAAAVTALGTDDADGLVPAKGTGIKGWLRSAWNQLTLIVANQTNGTQVSDLPTATKNALAPYVNQQVTADGNNNANSVVARDVTVAGVTTALGTEVSAPPTGTGARGWLANIWARTDNAATALGTETAAPTTGTGIRGWLQSLYGLLSPLISGGKLNVASTTGSLGSSSGSLALAAGSVVSIALPDGAQSVDLTLYQPSGSNNYYYIETSFDNATWYTPYYTGVGWILTQNGGAPSYVTASQYINTNSGTGFYEAKISVGGWKYFRVRQSNANTTATQYSMTIQSSAVLVAAVPAGTTPVSVAATLNINHATVAKTDTVVTAATLAAGGSYTAASDSIGTALRRETWVINTDQPGTAYAEHSSDNTNWFALATLAVVSDSSGTAAILDCMTIDSYMRFRYVNGATTQGRFRVVKKTQAI